MATVRGKKRPASQLSVSRANSNPYDIPLALVPVRRTTGEDLMGGIACCVLFAVFLPIGAMLYLDILEAKHEVKAQVEKVEKLRREIERKKRDKEPDAFNDNPVFDRMRRPIQIPMSRPDKLG
jgi:hypothetical protein